MHINALKGSQQLNRSGVIKLGLAAIVDISVHVLAQTWGTSCEWVTRWSSAVKQVKRSINHDVVRDFLLPIRPPTRVLRGANRAPGVGDYKHAAWSGSLHSHSHYTSKSDGDTNISFIILIKTFPLLLIKLQQCDGQQLHKPLVFKLL